MAKMPGNTIPSPAANFCAAFTMRCSARPASRPPRFPRPLRGTSSFRRLKSLVPGSWIHANFNVWIGAPEDNRSWDYLYHARNFYAQAAPEASEAQRQLAFEEILIAEGSDWNWWYGPEHHSANDREFDELYRKHLSNIYQAAGRPRRPTTWRNPSSAAWRGPRCCRRPPISIPGITGDMVRYFEWMGAAVYTADRRAGAMHGKQFLLDAVHAGIDETCIYGRLDFAENKVPAADFEMVVNLESWADEGQRPRRALRLDAGVEERRIRNWKVSLPDSEEPLAASDQPGDQVIVALFRNFEFKLPLEWLLATPVTSTPESGNGKPMVPVATRLRMRFSLWQNGLPADALPVEGWIELPLLSEEDLIAQQ